MDYCTIPAGESGKSSQSEWPTGNPREPAGCNPKPLLTFSLDDFAQHRNQGFNVAGRSGHSVTAVLMRLLNLSGLKGARSQGVGMTP